MRVLLLTCFLTAAMLQADTLYLRDGQAIRGTFISGSSQSIRFLPDGGRAELYPITRIERLAFGDAGAARSSAREDRNRTEDRSRMDDRNRIDDRNGNDDRSRNDDRRYDNNDRNYESSRSRSGGGEVASGTQITVRMIDNINSNETDIGRRYRASLDQDLMANGRVLASRGSDAVVEVVRVEQGRAIGGREQIALALTEISANGRRLTPVTQNAEISSSSRGSENVKVIGGTAALGAIIGAIAGGGRGAAIGAAAGAATGTGVQAVRGQKIEVPSETQLLFTLSQPLSN